MDKIKTPEDIDLNDSRWRIYTNTMAMPPQFIGEGANINRSLVADGCQIFGQLENTVVSHGVSVGKNTIIKDSVIMPNVKIGDNVIIEKAMIGEGAVIENNACIRNNNDEINGIYDTNQTIIYNGIEYYNYKFKFKLKLTAVNLMAVSFLTGKNVDILDKV